MAMMNNPSVSTVQDFKSCPLLYKLKHIVGLRKIEDESADHHLKFGHAFHAGLEVVYKAKMESDETSRPFIVNHALVKEAKAAFLANYSRQLDTNDNAKTQESGCFAIEDYLRKYSGEDKQRWRVLAVEAPETYDGGFITHLDLVMENREHGGVYGFDLKTTKKALNYDFWRKFEPNSQIVRYVDFIKSKYGSCEGFYIRATQFGYRSRAYKGEPAGFYVKHEAQLFNVNEAQIEMERGSSQYWQMRIEAATELEQSGEFDSRVIWGMNTDHCQWCTYRPICMAGWTWESDADLILNAYRQCCNQLTETLRACALDVGHDGPHSEHYTASKEEMSIEVEI